MENVWTNRMLVGMLDTPEHGLRRDLHEPAADNVFSSRTLDRMWLHRGEGEHLGETQILVRVFLLVKVAFSEVSWVLESFSLHHPKLLASSSFEIRFKPPRYQTDENDVVFYDVPFPAGAVYTPGPSHVIIISWLPPTRTTPRCPSRTSWPSPILILRANGPLSESISMFLCRTVRLPTLL